MRVAHLSPSHISNEALVQGGGIRFPLELSKALSRRAEVACVTFGGSHATYTLEGVSVEEIPVPQPLRLNLANPFNLSFLPILDSFDLVHCHSYNAWVTNFALLYAALRGKPVCLTDHGGGGLNFTHLYRSLRRRPRFLDLGNLVDRFLLVSHCSARSFPEHTERIQVVYGGVDPARFHPVSNTRESILCVGRLLPQKGQNYLLEAMPRDRSPPVHLVGGEGEGEYLNLLHRLGNDLRVRYSATTDDLVLRQYYSSALVTVVPSVGRDVYGRTHHEELLSLVLLESMACGTPVICTSVGGMPEIVEEGKTGFIVPPNDPVALRERIRYFIDNPNESDRMGESGRLRVLREFTWEAVAARCLGAYEEIL